MLKRCEQKTIKPRLEVEFGTKSVCTTTKHLLTYTKNKKGSGVNKNTQDAIVHDGRFFQTIVRQFTSKSGKQLEWEMIKRKTFGRIVAVAAITPEREVIMEKNWRVPLLDYVFELPAGLMDKPNESEKDCAKRELLEETGYQTDSLDRIICGSFNTGVTDDEIVYFCGLNARLVQEPHREEEEDIEVIKMPINCLEEFLYCGRHKVDIKTACILPYLRKKGLLK